MPLLCFLRKNTPKFWIDELHIYWILNWAVETRECWITNFIKKERFKRQGYSCSPWSCNCAFQLFTGFMFSSQEFADQDFVEQKSADNIWLPYEILAFVHVRYDFSMLDSAMLPRALRGAINPQWTIPLVCGTRRHHWCLQKLINP